MNGLDARSCLGLVLVVSGLRALTQPLFSLVEVLIMMDGSLSESAPLLLPVLAAMLQVASGCTFAFGKYRAGWGCFAGYAAATLGFAVFGLVEFREANRLAMIGGFVETLGIPVAAAIGLALRRPTGSAPRSEVGVLLVILGISTIVGSGMYLAQRVRMFWPNVHDMPGEVLLVSLWLAPAILQARAGLQLRRGIPTAERTLKLYVLVALIAQTVTFALTVLFNLALQRERLQWMFAIQVVSAMTSIALPLLIWAFVRHHRAPLQETRVPTTPAWYALLALPFLAARPLVVDELVAPSLGSEIAIAVAAVFTTQAVATLLAARASLGDRLTAARHALIASALGLVTTAVIVVIHQVSDEYYRPLHTGPLVPLVVTGAVIAWLHRTARTPVPRAVATQR